jgi:hypothetical protein
MSRPRGPYVIDAQDMIDPRSEGPISGPAPARVIALRTLRLIEYGGPLEPGDIRPTLVECRRRQGRRPCLGLLCVAKEPDHTLVAYCEMCHAVDSYIHNWQDSLYADGPLEPLPVGKDTIQ